MPSVTRKTRQTRERRRAELASRLLAAARQVVADGENLTHVRVDRLAEIAGFSRSTFYGYFADKGDLLHAWFDAITADLETVAQACAAADHAPSREELRERLTTIADAYRPHVGVMAALYDAAAYEPTLQEAVSAFVARDVALMEQHIARGRAEGWIAQNVDADAAAWLVWMIERGQHQLAPVDGLADVLYLTLYAYR